MTRSGAVAGKVLLEREYSRDKLTAQLRAQREALRLHGLSDVQIQSIENERRLLRELQVFAPSIDTHEHDELHFSVSQHAENPSVSALQHSIQQNDSDNEGPHAGEHNGPLILKDLVVHKGQSVAAGETLCVLTDYQTLFIEGLAFEQDIDPLRDAFQNDWKVHAIFNQSGTQSDVVADLVIAYIANQIDPDSRTLRFFVRLPNEITKQQESEGHRYVQWRYVPGQRLQLRVPVQKWEDQIVLPVDAVAREGAEFYVFQENGDHFDRVPVHVKYRDQYNVVIDNDGSIFPGDVIAMRAAHQMQMALRNRATGGVDPHAGHNH
ncbi:MAG: efflux RND transporter periplasmic adaptor subunit [Pirellulaceae bacterium]